TRRYLNLRVGSDHGRRVAEVEHRQLVPIRVHVQASSLASRPDVLLEGVEVADRRRSRDGGQQFEAAQAEDIGWPIMGFGARSFQRVCRKDAEQRSSYRQCMDTMIDDHAAPLGADASK